MLTLPLPPLQLPKLAEDGDTVTATTVGTVLSEIEMLELPPGVPAMLEVPPVLHAASPAAARNATATRVPPRRSFRPADGATPGGVRSTRIRMPDRRKPSPTASNASSPAANHHVQGGTRGPGPVAGRAAR